MKKLLVCTVLLVSVAFSAIVYAQSPVAVDPITRTIVIDKAVHFRDAENQIVLVPAGAYWITPEAEALELTNLDSEETFVIAALSGQHENQIASPLVLSIEANANQPDRHVIMFLFPDGLELAAAGSYSGVQPRGLPDQASSFENFAFEGAKQQRISRAMNGLELAAALTAESGETANALSNVIRLGTPVHFAGTEGQDLLVPARVYWVTPEEDTKTIELFDLDDGTSFVIVANTEERVDDDTDLTVFATSGTDEQPDIHEVVVLLADGSQLVAEGTYSGVRTRGILSAAKKKAAAAARNAARKRAERQRRRAKRRAELAAIAKQGAEAAVQVAQNVGDATVGAVAEAKRRITAKGVAIKKAFVNFVNDPNCAEPVLKKVKKSFVSLVNQAGESVTNVTTRSSGSAAQPLGQYCGHAGEVPCKAGSQQIRYCGLNLDIVTSPDLTGNWADGLCMNKRGLIFASALSCGGGLVSMIGGAIASPAAGGGIPFALVGVVATAVGCGTMTYDYLLNMEGYKAMGRYKRDQCQDLTGIVEHNQNPMLNCSGFEQSPIFQLDQQAAVATRGRARKSPSDTAFARNMDTLLACSASVKKFADAVAGK